MTGGRPLPEPDRAKQVETACGGWALLKPDTPFICYQNEVVYFCSPDCKELYEKNPLNSCMVGRLLVGR